MATRHSSGVTYPADHIGSEKTAVRSAEPEYTPSPQEIEQAAAEIRAGWDHREHYRRAGQLVPIWTALNYGQEVDADSVGWTAPIVKAGWAQ